VIWGVVKQKAKSCEIPFLAPHDLRQDHGDRRNDHRMRRGNALVNNCNRYVPSVTRLCVSPGCVSGFRR
jgi:hypothetical protein